MSTYLWRRLFQTLPASYFQSENLGTLALAVTFDCSIEAGTSRAELDLSSTRRKATWPVVAAVFVGVGILVVCQLVRGSSYWSYSEGVYALTSRLFLHGHPLYSDLIVAQPPPLFFFGAGVLALPDSLGFLRLVVGGLQLIAALIGGRIAWRLTGSPWAMVLAVVLGLLAPWGIHEHGFLTPETLALPMILGSILFAARAKSAPLAGVILGVLALTKMPYLAFCVAIVIASADRWRVARFTCGTIAVLLFGWFAVFGVQPMWHDLVVAQQQTGFSAKKSNILEGQQGIWNLLGLLVCTLFAWLLRRTIVSKDPALVRTTFAATLAGFVVCATIIKNGTGLNAWVPLEAVLAVTATMGVFMVMRAIRGSSPSKWILSKLGGSVVSLAAALVVVQGISVLVSSPTKTYLFAPPFKTATWPMRISDYQVRRAVQRAKKCPAGQSIRGQAAPFMAFVARRSVPIDQPDRFIVGKARMFADTLNRVESAGRGCDPIHG